MAFPSQEYEDIQSPRAVALAAKRISDDLWKCAPADGNIAADE
jgi:hypothetical protein